MRKSPIATSQSRPSLPPRAAVIVASSTHVSAGDVTGSACTRSASTSPLRRHPMTPPRRTSTPGRVTTWIAPEIRAGSGIRHSLAAVAWLKHESGGSTMRSAAQ